MSGTTLQKTDATVQRSLRHLLMSLSASLMKTMAFFIRNKLQSYTQSKSKTRRPTFARSSAILNNPSNMLSWVFLPLHGLPESGTHWFKTYQIHHHNEQSIIAATQDQRLLFIFKCLVNDQPSSEHCGIKCFLANDIWILAIRFFDNEVLCTQSFHSKPSKVPTIRIHFAFNSVFNSQLETNTGLSHLENILKLYTLSEEEDHLLSFICQRARGAYVASVAHLDLTYLFFKVFWSFEAG